jgi:hypothetical protein
MKLIETKTLGTSAATIEFVSIPQTFTDLVVLISARNTTTSIDLYMEFNANGSGYSGRILYGNGSSATAGTVGNQPVWITPSGATANTFGNASIYIPNYAGSTNKSYSGDSVTENNASLAYQFLAAGFWSNTAAITAIKLFGSDFAVGSTFSLYGITKGSDGITTVS